MADEPNLSEEELRRALERIAVADVLVQTVSTIASLVLHRLREETRDLEQARLGIEAVKALLPVLKGQVPDDLERSLADLLAQLQLAYANAVAS